MKKLALILGLALTWIPARATVISQNINASFTCTGSTGPFAFTFSVSAANAITVNQNGTNLSPTSYVVVPVNNNYDNGGSVTLNAACPNGQTLTISRTTPLTQSTVFTDNMPVPMKSFENGLDKLTEIAQELGATKGGTGSVNSVAVANANGFQGTVLNPNTNPTITISVDSTHVLPTNTGNGSTFLNSAGTYSTLSGGGLPSGSQYQLQTNGGSSLFGHSNAYTDATGNPLNVPGNISAPALNPFNQYLALGLPQAAGTASNYVQRDASGNITNTAFPQHQPWNFTQYDWQGYGCCDVFTPLEINLNLQGGEINAVNYNGDIGLLSKTLNMQTSGQNGGADSDTITQNSPGDFVDSTKVVLGRGKSRGYDESGEMKRWFIAINNATFGGNATIGAVDAQGNQPFQLANPGTYGYSFKASGEEMPFVDITAKASAGNILNVALWATNHNYMEITGDAASNITSTYGVSSYATTTQAITGDIYTGTCPTWTDTGTTPPGGTTFITDRAGVNSYHAANPGLNSPADYCVSIGATTGTALTVGTTVYISDSYFPPEYVTVKSIVDANHFTAYMKHPHAVGSYVTWGGGVGYGLSSGNDDRPVGTSSTNQNDQTAITHLVYPILMTEASNKVVIDVIGLGGAEVGFNSLAYANNAPAVPLTLTIDASGNVTGSNALTTANYETYNLGGSGGTGHVGGPLETLPPPVLTFTCTVAPTITLAYTVNPSNGLPTYVPTTTATGSGCTGVTVAATAPNPLNIYPMTWTYRVTDPALTDKTVWSTSGYILTDPLAAPSAWHASDQVESTRWWQSFAGSGQEHYQQDDDVARSGDFGPRNQIYYSGVQNNAAAFQYANEEPVAHYIGKFTNPNGYGPSSTPSDQSMVLGPLLKLSFANGGLAVLDEPPITGQTLIQVHCFATANDPLKDHPCAHGIHKAYRIWDDDQNGANDYLLFDPSTHILSSADSWNVAALTVQGAASANKFCTNNGQFCWEYTGGSAYSGVTDASGNPQPFTASQFVVPSNGSFGWSPSTVGLDPDTYLSRGSSPGQVKIGKTTQGASDGDLELATVNGKGVCASDGTNCVAGIANIQVALPTSALAANTCSSVITTPMAGVTTTSTFTTAFATDASAVTGYGSSGGLSIVMWPTAGNNNLKLCNPTASSITPGAMTLNIGAK